MKKLILLIILFLIQFSYLDEINPIPNVNTNNYYYWVIKIEKKENLDFYQAYDQIKRWEGGYANDPNDRGGETYCGIARNCHPNWPGWNYIDMVKSNGKINYNQKFNSLSPLVIRFYKKIYWDKSRLNEVGSQGLADELFDIGVNMGRGTAIRLLKESINLLNKNGKRHKELIINGQVTDEVISILSIYYEKGTLYHKVLIKTLNGLQLKRYIEICKNNPSQERYLVAWLKRV